MKIVVLVIGKTNQAFVQDGIEEFCGRLKHYIPFDIEVVADIKNAKNRSFQEIKDREGDILLKYFRHGDHIVLLDENGKQYSSLEFAHFIEKKTHQVGKRLVFVVGGAYGFSEKIYDKANEKISISKMTFSHQMIRLIFVEQIYRAMTIMNNEPYHHE